MRQFTYTITDDLGIHARPAGQLAKLAKSFPDTASTLTLGERSAKLNQLMALMGLGVKKGHEITVIVEGTAEDEAHDALLKFFQEHL